MGRGDVGTQRGRKKPQATPANENGGIAFGEKGDEKTEMASPYSVGFERWRWEEDALLLSARNRAPLGLIEKENDGPNVPPQYLAFPPHQAIPWVLGFPSLFEVRDLVSQTQRKVFPPWR